MQKKKSNMTKKEITEKLSLFQVLCIFFFVIYNFPCTVHIFLFTTSIFLCRQPPFIQMSVELFKNNEST